MASLSSHGNVYNTCLLILRQKGYRLWLEGKADSDGYVDLSTALWKAEKNGYDFAADNPIELMGLISIYEHLNPIGNPVPYWWLVEGEDITLELIRSAILHEEW